MLAEILKSAYERFVRPDRNPVLEAAGRTLVYDDAAKGYKEVHPRDNGAHSVPATLADFQSLMRWAKDMNLCLDEPGQVCVSRRNKSTALTPTFVAPPDEREHVEKAFFTDYMPPAGWVDYLTFTAWLDFLGDRIKGYDELRGAFSSLSAADGTVTKVKERGALITVEGETKKGAGAEGVVPRELSAIIPFGDPDHETTVRFRLTIVVRDGGVLAFQVAHIITDGAFDAYVQWAADLLQADGALPEGWVVLVTP